MATITEKDSVLDCSAQAYSNDGPAVVWSIPAMAQELQNSKSTSLDKKVLPTKLARMWEGPRPETLIQGPPLTIRMPRNQDRKFSVQSSVWLWSCHFSMREPEHGVLTVATALYFCCSLQHILQSRRQTHSTRTVEVHMYWWKCGQYSCGNSNQICQVWYLPPGWHKWINGQDYGPQTFEWLWANKHKSSGSGWLEVANSQWHGPHLLRS